jgi:magnesium-transporting ATPase (P-type)
MYTSVVILYWCPFKIQHNVWLALLQLICTVSSDNVSKDRTGLDVEVYRSANPKVHEIPFNSSNKWQMSVHARNGREVMFLKGAPDVLLDKCYSRYVLPDG